MNEMIELYRSIANSNTYQGLITQKQTIMINRMLGKYFPERSDRIRFISYCTERNLDSSKKMTCNEASAFISLMYVDDWQENPIFVDMIKEYSIGETQ